MSPILSLPDLRAQRQGTKETAPSPATWLNRGGTSLWEDWGNGASRNHIMFGEFVCWAYQYLAGIRLKDGATAFSEVVVEPRFIGDLEWVRASVKLPKGELSSAWSRKNGKTELIVRVPEGTRAFVRLPGGRESVVGPGIQTFVVE